MPFYEIRQFDRVKIRTTKNIKYLSSPPGTMPSPHGFWSVVGNCGRDLVISKNGAICKVPINDIIIAGHSEADRLLEIINDRRKEKERQEE